MSRAASTRLSSSSARGSPRLETRKVTTDAANLVSFSLNRDVKYTDQRLVDLIADQSAPTLVVLSGATDGEGDYSLGSLLLTDHTSEVQRILSAFVTGAKDDYGIKKVTFSKIAPQQTAAGKGKAKQVLPVQLECEFEYRGDNYDDLSHTVTVRNATAEQLAVLVKTLEDAGAVEATN